SSTRDCSSDVCSSDLISHGDETLRFTDMVQSRRASSLNVWLALGIVYVVWGSTYLAIAIAVQTLPPFLYAGLRFLLAGLILAGRSEERRVGKETRSRA